jgi:hypothetical protein
MSPVFGVLIGRDIIGGDNITLLPLLVVSLQKRNTPAATGPSTAAFAQLADPFGLVDAQMIDNLPLRDMKTVIDFVVELHGWFTLSGVVSSRLCR